MFVREFRLCGDRSVFREPVDRLTKFRKPTINFYERSYAASTTIAFEAAESTSSLSFLFGSQWWVNHVFFFQWKNFRKNKKGHSHMQRSTNRFSTGAEREAQTTQTQAEVRYHVNRNVLAVARRKSEDLDQIGRAAAKSEGSTEQARQLSFPFNSKLAFRQARNMARVASRHTERHVQWKAWTV